MAVLRSSPGASRRRGLSIPEPSSVSFVRVRCFSRYDASCLAHRADRVAFLGVSIWSRRGHLARLTAPALNSATASDSRHTVAATRAAGLDTGGSGLPGTPTAGTGSTGRALSTRSADARGASSRRPRWITLSRCLAQTTHASMTRGTINPCVGGVTPRRPRMRIAEAAADGTPRGYPPIAAGRPGVGRGPGGRGPGDPRPKAANCQSNLRPIHRRSAASTAQGEGRGSRPGSLSLLQRSSWSEDPLPSDRRVYPPANICGQSMKTAPQVRACGREIKSRG